MIQLPFDHCRRNARLRAASYYRVFTIDVSWNPPRDDLKILEKTMIEKCLCVSSLLLFCCAPAFAWDPIGDITHPDRIVRNVGRELDNAGKEIDRVRLEAQA